MKENSNFKPVKLRLKIDLMGWVNLFLKDDLKRS